MMTETIRPVALTEAEIEDCLSAVRASICDYYHQSCETPYYEEEAYLDDLIATLNGIEAELDRALAHIYIKEVGSSSITLEDEEAKLLRCSLYDYNNESNAIKKLKEAFTL